MLTLHISALLCGCASVPLAPAEDDQLRKAFAAPVSNTAGLYIYRNSHAGATLKKSVFIDGDFIGETAPMTYFYREIKPGRRNLSTESEFSNNDLILDAESGKNYYVRQYLKLGVFVAGAQLEQVAEDVGMKGVLECRLAQQAGN